MALVLVTPFPFVARWAFDGFDSPALDERLDETPPTIRGSLLVVAEKRTSFPSEAVTFTDTPDRVQDFYRLQGLTANDLRKMTSQDALQRVPVATIRDRPYPLTQTLAEILGQAGPLRRGTVVPATLPPRQITDEPIPAELPP
jgi:hypothetical protein